VSGIWKSYIDIYSWLLRKVASGIEPIFGTWRWGFAIILVTLLTRVVLLPITLRSARAIQANRDLVAVLRGVGTATDRTALRRLYDRAAGIFKEPMPVLFMQLPVVVPMYFAVRDLTRVHRVMPFLGMSHLGKPARWTIGGFLLILAIMAVGYLSARQMSAHFDNPQQRQGAVMSPIGIGAGFIFHPFVSGFILSHFVGAAVQYVVERVVLKPFPAEITEVRSIAFDPTTLAPELDKADILLACKSVEVAYDKVQVLFGVDLEIRRGEILALLGTNGAGKSTLLKAISGIVDMLGGSVFFEGREITQLDAIATAELGISQVPGGRGIFPTLTVEENLRAAAWMFRRDPEYVKTAMGTAQETFPLLRERWNNLGGDLSGGEQQMLTLAMAFLSRPKLLLVDELSLGLAPAIVEHLLGVVRAIHDQGTTIVLVEQSVNVALTIADRAYFMEKGEVRFSGPTDKLLERGDLLRSVFLKGSAAAHAEEDSGRRRRRADRKPQKDRIAADAEVVLEVSGLSKHFGGIRAVDKVSFDLRAGEILGLIGPNGSGKTTLVDLIFGFLAPDEGTVRFLGRNLSGWSPDQRARAGLGRSFQDARIFPSLTTAENLALALERHLQVRDHLAAALHLPAVVAEEGDVAWTVADLVELMGLQAFRDKLVSELSTGTRRIVDLGMTIAHNPSVLLLDEPSSGIAQRETEALGPLLERIREETACSMVVIEHNMPLITCISDRMIALETGRIIAEGLPQDVIHHPDVIESYLGGDVALINRSGATRRSASGRRRTTSRAGA
jgi:ABC-type branched-subunit amino acid transport system ATPase component